MSDISLQSQILIMEGSSRRFTTLFTHISSRALCISCSTLVLQNDQTHAEESKTSVIFTLNVSTDYVKMLSNIGRHGQSVPNILSGLNNSVSVNTDWLLMEHLSSALKNKKTHLVTLRYHVLLQDFPLTAWFLLISSIQKCIKWFRTLTCELSECIKSGNDLMSFSKFSIKYDICSKWWYFQNTYSNSDLDILKWFQTTEA